MKTFLCTLLILAPAAVPALAAPPICDGSTAVTLLGLDTSTGRALFSMPAVGGGNVETVDIWGRRRMAYDIDKKSEGIYAVIEIDAEPATVKELDRQLTLNESVLRTKVIRPELH